jgi:hypothetical protein
MNYQEKDKFTRHTAVSVLEDDKRIHGSDLRLPQSRD